MQNKIVDFGRSIGKTYWETPYDYLEEAGEFDLPCLDLEGKLYSLHAGQGRGVNLRVAEVPRLEDGYEYEPFVSRLFLFHSAAFLHLPDDMTTP